MTSKEHEVIIVGTSPILLIEGLMRARARQKVTFVEANASIGGAWSVAEAFHLQDLEAACHLIVNYRGVYRFLSDVCGVALETQEPMPLLYRRGRITPFNARRHLVRRCSGLTLRTSAVALVRLIEALSAHRWRLSRTKNFRVAQTLQSLADHRLYPWAASAENRAIQYPVGGTPAMLRHLIAELNCLGASFISGKVEHLTLCANGVVRATIANGEERTAQELVVSESADLESIETPDEKRTFQTRIKTHESLFVRLQNVSSRPFSYIEFPHDPLVERVTDITDFCRGTIVPGERILVCETPAGATRSAETREPEAIVAYLQTLMLLPGNAILAESALHDLTLRRGDASLIEYLRKLRTKAVTVVPSRGDLSLSIHRNLRRWQPLLSLHSRESRPSTRSTNGDAQGTSCKADLSTASIASVRR